MIVNMHVCVLLLQKKIYAIYLCIKTERERERERQADRERRFKMKYDNIRKRKLFGKSD